ncbi:Uncharacterized protein QTN25_002066 [Entamoeba marina]
MQPYPYGHFYNQNLMQPTDQLLAQPTDQQQFQPNPYADFLKQGTSVVNRPPSTDLSQTDKNVFGNIFSTSGNAFVKPTPQSPSIPLTQLHQGSMDIGNHSIVPLSKKKNTNDVIYKNGQTYRGTEEDILKFKSNFNVIEPEKLTFSKKFDDKEFDEEVIIQDNTSSHDSNSQMEEVVIDVDGNAIEEKKPTTNLGKTIQSTGSKLRIGGMHQSLSSPEKSTPTKQNLIFECVSDEEVLDAEMMSLRKSEAVLFYNASKILKECGDNFMKDGNIEVSKDEMEMIERAVDIIKREIDYSVGDLDDIQLNNYEGDYIERSTSDSSEEFSKTQRGEVSPKLKCKKIPNNDDIPKRPKRVISVKKDLPNE